MQRSAFPAAASLFALALPAFASHPAHSHSVAHGAPQRIAPTHSLHISGRRARGAQERGARHAVRFTSPAHGAKARLHPAALPIKKGQGRRGREYAIAARRAAHVVPVIAVVRPSVEHPQLTDTLEAAAQPIALPKLYGEHGRLLVPAALVGSHEILLHQNAMADADGLGRIQDDADLDAMRSRGLLIDLPQNAAVAVDSRLPLNRRSARPWTVQFLEELSREHYNRFHSPLQVTSAVRTVAFQQQLIHRNGNAAPADGDTASPHLTGQAIDLGKRGMPMAEIAWMRGYLLPLIEAGKIDVEEEFKQSCFHISVYRRYAPEFPTRYDVASRGIATTVPSALR